MSIISALNASETKNLLKFYLNGSNLQQVPALVGLTGIGKTAISKAVAKELNAELVYFNVAQIQEGEFALPVPVQSKKDNDKTVEAVVDYNLNYKLRDVLNNPDKKFIIMLDEFTRGTVPVISELMTFLNERELQGYKLHDNVRFLVALNPSQSMYGYADTEYAATEMDDAHGNRFTFIDMGADRNDWLAWAEQTNPETGKKNVHELVIAFLKDAKNHSYFYGKEKGGIRMRTPRTWDYLSKNLHDMEVQGLLQDQKLLHRVATQNLGYDVGGVFHDYVSKLLDAIDPERIVSNTKLPKALIEEFKGYDIAKQQKIMDGVVTLITNITSDEDYKITANLLDNIHDIWRSMESIDTRFAFVKDIANIAVRNGSVKSKYLEQLTGKAQNLCFALYEWNDMKEFTSKVAKSTENISK